MSVGCFPKTPTAALRKPLGSAEATTAIIFIVSAGPKKITTTGASLGARRRCGGGRAPANRLFELARTTHRVAEGFGFGVQQVPHKI
jgi:hypothetical protein